MRGDINDDGEVNAVDVNALYQAVEAGESPEAGDINNDGVVNTTDVSALKQHAIDGEPLPTIEASSSPLPVMLSEASKVHNLLMDDVITHDQARTGIDMLRDGGADAVRITDSGVSKVDQTTTETTSEPDTTSDDSESLPEPEETTSGQSSGSSDSSDSGSTSGPAPGDVVTPSPQPGADDALADDSSTSDESDSSLPVKPRTAIAAGVGLLALLGGRS
jgi:hypothetical protein